MHDDLYVRLPPERWKQVLRLLRERSGELRDQDARLREPGETMLERADVAGTIAQVEHGISGTAIWPTAYGYRVIMSLPGLEDVKMAYRTAYERQSSGD